MAFAAIERGIGTAILRVLGVFLLLVAGAALVAPRQPTLAYDMTLVRSSFLLLVVGAVAVMFARRRLLGALPPLHRLVPFAVTASGATICTLFALAGRYLFSWDARVVATIAEHVVTNRPPVTGYEYDYLSRYPNNTALLAVDRLCVWFGQTVGLPPNVVFIIINGVCLAIAVQSCYWLVSMLRGRWAGVAAQLLLLVLVGLSPWMTVSYTDLIALPFPVLTTALVVAAVRTGPARREAPLVAAAAAALLIGYEIKNTPIVTLVAIVVVAALALAARDTPARRLVAGGLVAGLLLFGVGVLIARPALPVAAGVNAGRINHANTRPLVWWFYMGTTQNALNPEGAQSYGGFDKQIVIRTLGMDGAAAGRYAAHQLRRRISALGPVGYGRFVANKAAWNWGDGMFWAFGEGTDQKDPVLADDALTPFVRTWNNPQYGLYRWRAALTQSLWLLLLLVAGARLLRARWRWDIGLVALSVLGIAAFTVVFQARSRYLLVYVPLVIALALGQPALREGGWWPRRARTAGTRAADYQSAASPVTCGPGAHLTEISRERRRFRFRTAWRLR